MITLLQTAAGTDSGRPAFHCKHIWKPNTQLIHVIPVDKQITVTSLALPKTVYVRINMFIFPQLASSSFAAAAS